MDKATERRESERMTVEDVLGACLAEFGRGASSRRVSDAVICSLRRQYAAAAEARLALWKRDRDTVLALAQSLGRMSGTVAEWADADQIELEHIKRASELLAACSAGPQRTCPWCK
ncbi:MAG: hypothetical protein KBD01_15820 [Acidobacteria bacterium]|nr:hypothetical protein [Acidobacteriota bacterium]